MRVINLLKSLSFSSLRLPRHEAYVPFLKGITIFIKKNSDTPLRIDKGDKRGEGGWYTDPHHEGSQHSQGWT